MRYQAALLPDAPALDAAGPVGKSARTMRQAQGKGGWWARQDSNPRPSRYERPALTAELQAPSATLCNGQPVPDPRGSGKPGRRLEQGGGHDLGDGRRPDAHPVKQSEGGSPPGIEVVEL